MSPLAFVLNMAGAAALLIWAVRLVRTGFERAFGGELRSWLRRSTASRASAAACGAAAAVLMQGSTAVAVLMAGFVSAGAIGGAAGLAIILGADLGSAVVALTLNTRPGLATPVLLLAGVLAFLRGSRRRSRQVGRILVGLALVFVSLDLIRAAGAPMADSAAALGAARYLAGNPPAAFAIAALFAWLVHASVAAVLLFATMAAQGLLAPDAALAMVLGANLGGSLIAFFLTLKSDAAVRRIVWSNLALRGGGALLALWALSALEPPTHLLGADPGARALHLHLLFNLALAAACLPFAGALARLSERLVPARAAAAGAARTALDPAVQGQPRRASACAVRELVHMGNRVEIMLREALPLFERFDEAAARRMQDEFERLRRMSLGVRIYMAGVRGGGNAEEVGTRNFELSAMAANLEAGAEAIARKAVDLARRKSMENLRFSEEGWREISDFHDTVLRNVQNGIAVLMSEDAGMARELVEQKERVRDIARDLQSRHLERLRQGKTESIETSSIHLELVRALKSVNTSFAMIAYPQLRQSGELLDSRLAGP